MSKVCNTSTFKCAPAECGDKIKNGQETDVDCGGSQCSRCSVGQTGQVSLVEGTALPVSVADSNTDTRSLIRFPDGTDTNNAAADWKVSSTPTPGAPNQP